MFHAISLRFTNAVAAQNIFADYLFIQRNHQMCYQGDTKSLFFLFTFSHILITSYISQYQNIIHHLNRIEIDLDDNEFLVQIECSSLQLMRQPIVLHAKGCFVIDYDTLTKVRRQHFILPSHDSIAVLRSYRLSFSAAGRDYNVHDFLHTIRTEIRSRQVTSTKEIMDSSMSPHNNQSFCKFTLIFMCLRKNTIHRIILHSRRTSAFGIFLNERFSFSSGFSSMAGILCFNSRTHHNHTCMPTSKNCRQPSSHLHFAQPSGFIHMLISL